MSFKVGEAPWEKDASSSTSFAVGKAPWEVEEQEAKDSPVRAFGEGAADVATLGWLNNIRGATEPLVFGALNKITGENVEADPYIEARDSYELGTKDLKENNPKSFMAGQIAGGVGQGLALAPITAANGLTALDRIQKAARVGAAMGAAQNTGNVEGELDYDVSKAIKNTAMGAGLGAGFQSAGEGIRKIGEKLPDVVKSFAEQRAVKALGPGKRDMDALNAKGKVNELGRQLLDDDIVTPFATPKKIADRLSPKIDEGMGKINRMIDKSDEFLNTKMIGEGSKEQVEALARSKVSTTELKDRLINQIREEFPGVPEEELAPAIGKIETWFKGKPDEMSIREFQDMKTGLNNFLKKSDYYKEMPGMAKEGLLSVRRGTKEAIEQKVDSVANLLGREGGQIKAANRNLGNYLEAQDIVSDKIGRDAANRSFSLTDYITGQGGASIGGLPMAVAGAVGNKVSRLVGNSMMASGADALSKKLIQMSPRFLEMSQKSPAAFANLVNTLASKRKFQENPSVRGPKEIPQQHQNFMQRLGEDPNSDKFLKNDKLKEQLKKYRENNNMKAVPAEQAQASFVNNN